MRILARFALLAFALAFLAGCGGQLPTGVPPTIAVAPTRAPVQQPTPIRTSGGNVLPWLSVWFTDPNPPDRVGTGIDQYVIPVLNAARVSIDLATFDFTLPSIADALVAASQRGVRVRVIVDDKNGEQELKQDDLLAQTGGKQPFQKLKDAGIPIVGGGRSNGLMHNKMIIVDRSTLFMGSWNMSYNDTYRNNNNLLQITNQKLIENYQLEFNEGFEKRLFGARSTYVSANPKLVINDVAVENYFSPDDKVMAKLVAEVAAARQSVRFIIFTYTHADLSTAMIAKMRAGVGVQGVIENRGASQGAFVPLFCAKVPVRLDGNKYTMHHKVIIIDNSVVITGSFNFTVSADTANDDNILIVRSPSVASIYLAEYAKIFAQADEPDATKYDCSATK